MLQALAKLLFRSHDDQTHDRLGNERSSKWPALRKRFLAANPQCAVCGGDLDLEAHHIKPFHVAPEKELDISNLLALCRPHHLLFGHLMSWESWNASVVEDAAKMYAKVETRP